MVDLVISDYRIIMMLLLPVGYFGFHQAWSFQDSSLGPSRHFNTIFQRLGLGLGLED